MTNMNAKKWIFGVLATVSLAIMLTPAQAAKMDSSLDAKTTAIIKRDFRDKGIAKADRVNQDKLQAMCSKYVDKLPEKLKVKLEAEQAKSIKWPADGKYMGD